MDFAHPQYCREPSSAGIRELFVFLRPGEAGLWEPGASPQAISRSLFFLGGGWSFQNAPSALLPRSGHFSSRGQGTDADLHEAHQDGPLHRLQHHVGQHGPGQLRGLQRLPRQDTPAPRRAKQDKRKAHESGRKRRQATKKCPLDMGGFFFVFLFLFIYIYICICILFRGAKCEVVLRWWFGGVCSLGFGFERAPGSCRGY